MSANPIDSTNTDKPTGSLEDLFRHHLAEAAVPPRPMVWEQLDNSLLQRQNELYRRRLTVTRWVAAASLAIASLAGTGWWATREALEQDRATLAAVTQHGAPTTTGSSGSQLGRGSAATPAELADGQAARAASRFDLRDATAATGRHRATAATAASRLGQPAGGEQPGAATAPTAAASMAGAAAPPNTQSLAVASAAGDAAVAGRGWGLGLSRPAHPAGSALGSSPLALALAERGSAARLREGRHHGSKSRTALGLARRAATATDLATADASEALAAAAGRSAFADEAPAGQLELLTSRMATLQPVAPQALSTDLAAVTVPADNTPAPVQPLRGWQYGASYTISAFSPNINFSREGGKAQYDYNPALGANSPALTEAAAAEYRANLRPGLSQRLAVQATRRLNGRWALRTGFEYTQQEASSASSLAFVGEQVPDFGQAVGGPMRTTNFRYRTAGLPLEVQYASPVKRGLSFYGRVGAVVTALLNVRAEVEGIPEATRAYSIAAEGPYRRVLTNLRGAAGVQYRPLAGSWTVSLGPVAETGLLTLNAHPAQDLGSQSRAYSLGVEAGVAFGRTVAH